MMKLACLYSQLNLVKFLYVGLVLGLSKFGNAPAVKKNDDCFKNSQTLLKNNWLAIFL
jgi:hypothetical protein